MAADVGQTAPDFTLPSDSLDNKVSLEETRREEPVILFFYHRAWAEERGSDFPLLSDFQREVVEKDGVKHKAGFPERAYFVVRQRGRCTG